MPDFGDHDIVGLAQLLDEGMVSPVELCRHFVDRVETLDPLLNAFLGWDPGPALEQARQAEDRRRMRRRIGLLDGIPIAVKDNIATHGLPTTAGSATHLSVGPDDATVVSALRASGAVVFGKTNLPELAFGPADSYVFGPTRNPWDLSRYAGGSSMGSGAAVAAGLVPGALGTDTTGSVRHPANWCGVVGLKPTYGLLPMSGVVPLAASLDHVGLLARSVRDCRVLLAAAQARPALPTESAVAPLGLRIGIARIPSWDGLAGRVRDALEAAVDVYRFLGATVVDVPLRGWDQAAIAAETILAHEALGRYGPLLARGEDGFGPGLRANLVAASDVTAQEYADAIRFATVFGGELTEVTRDLDVVLIPGRERVAPHLDAAGRVLDDPVGVRCAAPLNLTGWPALALPCGFDEAGMPVGMQLAARPWAEDLLLQVGEAFQQATIWHHQRPLLADVASTPTERAALPCSVDNRAPQPDRPA
ncbi:MAG: amidase [Actinomycetia bacterium]|nr:amidase [Actinomycetes bacterium]